MAAAACLAACLCLCLCCTKLAMANILGQLSLQLPPSSEHASDDDSAIRCPGQKLNTHGTQAGRHSQAGRRFVCFVVNQLILLSFCDVFVCVRVCVCDCEFFVSHCRDRMAAFSPHSGAICVFILSMIHAPHMKMCNTLTQTHTHTHTLAYTVAYTHSNTVAHTHTHVH